MQVPGRIVPWIFMLLALPVALLGLEASAPTACGEVPHAFAKGVTTEQSTTLEVLASTCTITDNSDGSVVEETIVNWSGILAALAGLAGAWLLGALIGKQMPWKRALAGIAASGAAMFVALATFFV